MGYRCIHRDIALNAREPATLSSHATVSEDRATPEGRKILDRCGSEFESGVAAAPADQMWCAEKRGSSWRFSASASWPQGQLDIRHYAASSLRGDRPHWSGGAPRIVRSAAADLHAADDPAATMVAHATVFPPAAAMAWRDMPRGRTVPLCEFDAGIGGNATSR